MKSYLTRGLPLAGALLLAVTPMAGAWNLVSKINADARQMPGGPTTTTVSLTSIQAGFTVEALPVVCSGRFPTPS